MPLHAPRGYRPAYRYRESIPKAWGVNREGALSVELLLEARLDELEFTRVDRVVG